jgi:fructose-1-phosphate kinase PfkB-like protein
MNWRLPFLAMMTTMPPPPPPQQQPPLLLVVIGLNGALQKRFVLSPGEVLIPGNVHRAATIQNGVGGKGQDAAIALHCLLLSANKNNKSNNKVQQQLVQFIGRGSAGDAVYDMLVDRLGESAMTLTVRSASGMRTCTSIVAADVTTELVEPSGHITDEELQELLDKTAEVAVAAASQRIHHCATKGVCIMGSMPPGCPSTTYGKLYSQLAGPFTVCVVDSVTGISQLIETANTMRKDTVIGLGRILYKVNASELYTLVGICPKNKIETTGGIDPTELLHAVQLFDLKYSPQGALVGLAITDGKHPAYFVSLVDDDNDNNDTTTKFQLFQIPISPILLDLNETLYPIGAGDAVAAGTLAAWVYLQGAESSTSTEASIHTIPESCCQLLSNRVETLLQNQRLSREVAKAVSAFSFGLICGSASCLQEENSVLDTSDVARFFQRVDMPRVLTLPPPMTNAPKTS